MAKTFPYDCSADCKYYSYTDIGKEYYTNSCDKLDLQVDDVDVEKPNYKPHVCPLSEKERAEMIKE